MTDKISRLAERLRWRIARTVNRLPGQCWSDLVMWALKHRGDLARTGTCYCGKLRQATETAQADRQPS